MLFYSSEMSVLSPFGPHVPNVVPLRSGEEVVGADAEGVVASMQNLQARRYWAKVDLLGNSMRPFALERIESRASHGEGAVATVLAGGTLPLPATISLFDFLPESLNRAIIELHRMVPSCDVMPSAVRAARGLFVESMIPQDGTR